MTEKEELWRLYRRTEAVYEELIRARAALRKEEENFYSDFHGSIFRENYLAKTEAAAQVLDYMVWQAEQLKEGIRWRILSIT